MDSDLDASSARLLSLAHEGDDLALDALVGRYLPRLRRWARGRIPPTAWNLPESDHLVLETLVACLRHVDPLEVRREGALQAHIRQALTRRLADAFPGSGGCGGAIGPDSGTPGEHTSPLEAAVGSEAHQRYEQALQALGAADREAVILRIELCYDFAEVAAMLGVDDAAAARAAVSRALARLSREMRHAR